MKGVNEITISGSECGSISFDPVKEGVVEYKPGLIQIQGDLLEEAIGENKEFDPKLDTEIILTQPAVIPIILFGRRQFIKIKSQTVKPIEKVITRKECWFEDSSGDIIKCKYDHLHSDGCPIYRNPKLDDSTQQKFSDNSSKKSESIRIDLSLNKDNTKSSQKNG